MFYIACTRFNNSTYKENIEYRIKYNEAVIYGPAYKIRDIYPPGALIFVAEMNNERNRIEGIGLIKNSLISDNLFKVYNNGEYNRYIYRGKYWIGRDQLDHEILEIFDNILFKGKSHMKFRTGITILTEKIFTHWIYELSDLKQKIKITFLNKFKNTIETEIKDNFVIETKEQKETKEIIVSEEVFEIIPKKRRRNICCNK